MSNLTAREEIVSTLKSHGWSVIRADQPTLIAGWRGLRVVVEFTSTDNVKAALIKYYKPFNEGPIEQPIAKDRRRQVLAFIRGEGK